MRQAKHLPLPRSRKRGSGAESAGYGRFGECRGEAPEGERAPVWRASAPVHCRTVTSASVARTVDGMRLSALRLPLYEPGANLAWWLANLGRGARRENEFLFRHCEERSDKAIQSLVAQKTGLLRFARNDEGKGSIRESEPSGNAPSPLPLPARGERERAVDRPRAFVSRRATFVGMIFSENRHPPSGQVRGQIFSGSCLK